MNNKEKKQKKQYSLLEKEQRFEEAGLKPTVTIGRFLFKPVDEIIEPGTTAYNNITGALDILAQIFYGRPNKVALTIGVGHQNLVKLVGQKHLLNLRKQFNLKLENLFENTGLLQGNNVKLSLDQHHKNFLLVKNGVKFKQFLWENNTSDIIAASKK